MAVPRSAGRTSGAGSHRGARSGTATGNAGAGSVTPGQPPDADARVGRSTDWWSATPTVTPGGAGRTGTDRRLSDAGRLLAAGLHLYLRYRRLRWAAIGLAIVVPYLLIVSLTLAFTTVTAPPMSGIDVTADIGVLGDIPYADLFNQTIGLGIDPRLVAAVAWAESGYAPEVVQCRRSSAAGALGIMQLMPGTAEVLGVDPCEPEEAIPGGARYLFQQYERFETWELALAAYNAGPGAVQRHDGIPPFRETQEYVPKVMSKWEEYRQRFPSGTVGGGAGGPLGSTARFVDRRNTPTMQRLVDIVVPRFGRGHGIGCFRNDPDGGDHPVGRACDFIMSRPLNTMPTPEYLEHGWALANWLVANAEEYDVDYVIWQEQIWSIGRAGEGWRPYTRYPDGNLQEKHYDHVHVSVLR